MATKETMTLGFDKELGKVLIDGKPYGDPITLTVRYENGEIGVVPDFDYVAEATLTLSNQFNYNKVSRFNFNAILGNAIEALQDLDKVKKSLFYGRDNDLAQLGMENCLFVADGILTSSTDDSMTRAEAEQLVHGIIGLATEAGELLELLENTLNGTKLDLTNLKEEVGDGKWYMAILAKVGGFMWGDDERVNIKKLRARFPNAFTEYDANNRDLAGERVILETDPNQLTLPIAEDSRRERFDANSGGMLSGADTN